VTLWLLPIEIGKVRFIILNNLNNYGEKLMNTAQIEPTNSIMFPKHEVYRYRLTPFIEKRIADSGAEENNPYLQKYSTERWIKYIIQEMEQLPLNQFLVISDEDLKQRVGGLMSLELVAGILTDLTTEQLQAFDECLRRQ
jgi:hypothetical protein